MEEFNKWLDHIRANQVEDHNAHVWAYWLYLDRLYAPAWTWSSVEAALGLIP